MIVPTYSQGPIVEKDGTPTPGFAILLKNLIQNMQLSISDEGFLIPSVDRDQMATIQSSFQTGTVDPSSQTTSVGVQVGTMVFNTNPIGVPNGQLYVLLNDGTFHPVTNT